MQCPAGNAVKRIPYETIRKGCRHHESSTSDRQCAYRSRLALALDRRLFRSAVDLPQRAGPHAGIRGLHIHLCRRGVLQLGRKRGSRHVRRDPRPRTRRPLGHRGRMVGTARLQSALRGVFCPPRTVQPALFQKQVRRDRRDRLQRGFVRAQRHASADTEAVRHARLCIHASERPQAIPRRCGSRKELSFP